VSQETVEVAKRATLAFNRRDDDSYDEIFTQDFEWFPAFPTTLESEGYRGREGVERYFEEISDTWDEFRVVHDEYRQVGGSVLMLARFEGRGKTSGVAVDSTLAAAYDFRDGKISQIRVFFSRDEALKAVGLEE